MIIGYWASIDLVFKPQMYQHDDVISGNCCDCCWIVPGTIDDNGDSVL